MNCSYRKLHFKLQQSTTLLSLPNDSVYCWTYHVSIFVYYIWCVNLHLPPPPPTPIPLPPPTPSPHPPTTPTHGLFFSRKRRIVALITWCDSRKFLTILSHKAHVPFVVKARISLVLLKLIPREIGLFFHKRNLSCEHQQYRQFWWLKMETYN